MGELIQGFIDNLNAGDVWYGFLMLAVFYILKKEPFKVFAHFSEKKDNDLSQAQSLLASDKLSNDTDELLREHVEREVFSKYYGIRAGKEMRAAMLKCFKKNENEIGWHDLRRAYPYIKLDERVLKVSLRWWDHVMRWLVTGLSWLMGAYAILVLVVAVVSRAEDQLQFFGLTIMAIFLLALAVFFSTLNWPFHSARKISQVRK